MDEVEILLEELTNAHGPSGFEGPVRRIMQRELSVTTDSLETDGIGSLIARLGSNTEKPRIMMAGHMDEVGLMVKLITDDGYIKFQPLGGWLDQALINQRWIILSRLGPVQGVTGIKTPHVIAADARNQIFKRDQMFIDIGARNKEDVIQRFGIRPGDPIAPDSKFTLLGTEGFYLAKAWDDRIGLAVIVEVMKRLSINPPPNVVYGVSTVQEEVGLRGAHTSSHLVEPDIGINIESGVASDYPGITQEESQESLGKGPAIFLHDSSMIPSIKLRDLVVDLAETNKIPIQFDVLSGYGEDGAEMQKSRSGIPAINIAVPTRYLHSHYGIICRQDFDATVNLVTALIYQLNAETVNKLSDFS